MGKAKKPFGRIMDQLATLGRMGLEMLAGQTEIKRALAELNRRDREQSLTICLKHVEPWPDRRLAYMGCEDKPHMEKMRREMIAGELAKALLDHGIVQISEEAVEMGMCYRVELRLLGVDPRIAARFCNNRVDFRGWGGGDGKL